MAEWKKVPGWPYEASDDGRVRRLETGREVSPQENDAGYLRVDLCKNARARNFGVHKLVLMAFAGPPPEGHEADHINGDITDNCIENLRWLPVRENRGFKLTEEMAVAIREAYASGASQQQLGKEYGVHPDTISLVVLGKTWSDAGGPIAEPTYNGGPRLTEEQVLEIRRRYGDGGVSHRDLASEYGVVRSQIGRILNYERWPDLKPADPTTPEQED